MTIAQEPITHQKKALTTQHTQPGETWCVMACCMCRMREKQVVNKLLSRKRRIHGRRRAGQKREVELVHQRELHEWKFLCFFGLLRLSLNSLNGIVESVFFLFMVGMVFCTMPPITDPLCPQLKSFSCFFLSDCAFSVPLVQFTQQLSAVRATCNRRDDDVLSYDSSATKSVSTCIRVL